MTNQQSLNKTASDIIICDTNVVILMTLFKPTVMFAALYSFGKIKVHQCVIDQLQNWVDKNNQKVDVKKLIEASSTPSFSRDYRFSFEASL